MALSWSTCDRNALTLVSGELRQTNVFNTASNAFLRYSVEYRALTLSVGNSTVVLDGAMTKTFGPNNAVTPSGEAQMRAGGTMAARLYFDAQAGFGRCAAPVPVCSWRLLRQLCTPATSGRARNNHALVSSFPNVCDLSGRPVRKRHVMAAVTDVNPH